MPERIWAPLDERGDIEWLAFPTQPAPREHWTRVTGIGGGGIDCRIGRVTMLALDTDGRSLPPVPVIAKFPHDGATIPRILVGMHASVLQGRFLMLDANGSCAWLEQP